jgi:hypothetical protein
MTWTVNVLVPAASGVPLMMPVEAFKVSPAGRPPLTTDQLYGALPPVATRVCAYATPTTPPARVEVPTDNVLLAVTVMASVAVAV